MAETVRQIPPRRYHHPDQGDTATLLRTSEETAGEYTLIEIEVAPGGGTIPHFHLAYSEEFEVLEGGLTVEAGGRRHLLRPGERAVAPTRTLHRFHNHTPEPARFRVRLSPGSPGFENALRAGYGLASDGLTRADGTPRNPLHLALLLQWSEIRLPGARTLLEPALRALAWIARRRGVEEELLARYCR